MIRVTFIDHSGFLVELPSVTLLFDWQDGTLPALREDVPLAVFASHHHPDHFNPQIFALDDGKRNVRFLLGKDIKLSHHNRAKWKLSRGTEAKLRLMAGGDTEEPFPGVTVESFPSTDEGVAFLVTADGLTVYHAGDLNWWHWEGEDKAWNRNMEVDFKKYVEPLRGRRLDFAMLPLDPRLEEAGFWGPKYYLETADVGWFFPMHQWEDFDFTADFLGRFTKYASQTVYVDRNGQSWEFSDRGDLVERQADGA